jgi:cytochrome c553
MKLLSVLLLVSLLVTVGIPSALMAADNTQDLGPEIIKFKMGDLYLPFQHWKHQKLQNSKCFYCHSVQEWKIEAWGKEVAHQMCISCHERNDKGPVNCKECHNTSYTSMQKDHP